jgi:Protein of unknown function (DUF4238)
MSSRKRLKSQNQHELPEKYLKAFCAPNTSFVWVFRRGSAYSPAVRRRKGNPYRSGIHETASKVNRYAGLRMDGTFDVEGWELELQRREHAVDEVLTKLRAKKMIDAAEREAFISYLILTWLRVSKRWRDAESRARAHVADFDFEALSRELAFMGNFTGAQQVLKAGTFLRSNAGIKNLLLSTMFEDMRQCRSAVLKMEWHFVCAPRGTYFITCDAPFIFDEMLGLQTSQVQFPISPEIMLVAHHDVQYRSQFAMTSIDEALRLNTVTMLAAHDEVYAPSQDEWIHSAWNYGVTFDPHGARINPARDVR